MVELLLSRGSIRETKTGGADSLPPSCTVSRAALAARCYSPEVPTQPLSETSTVTPSGAVYFTSTFAYR